MNTFYIDYIDEICTKDSLLYDNFLIPLLSVGDIINTNGDLILPIFFNKSKLSMYDKKMSISKFLVCSLLLDSRYRHKHELFVKDCIVIPYVKTVKLQSLCLNEMFINEYVFNIIDSEYFLQCVEKFKKNVYNDISEYGINALDNCANFRVYKFLKRVSFLTDDFEEVRGEQDGYDLRKFLSKKCSRNDSDSEESTISENDSDYEESANDSDYEESDSEESTISNDSDSEESTISNDSDSEESAISNDSDSEESAISETISEPFILKRKTFFNIDDEDVVLVLQILNVSINILFAGFLWTKYY
jgi:hypothetical protein